MPRFLLKSPEKLERSAVALTRSLGAALRLASEDPVEDGDHEAGDGADKEGRPPIEHAAQHAAGRVADCGSDGDGEIEDGQDSVAGSLVEKVREHGGCEDAERGLAHSHQRVADEHAPVVVHPGRGEGEQAPEDGAAHDERLAADAVAEPARKRSAKHVNDEHRRGQQAELFVAPAELLLDERLGSGQDVAVDVVEQVKADEKAQRNDRRAEARTANGLGQSRHADSEYPRAANLPSRFLGQQHDEQLVVIRLASLRIRFGVALRIQIVLD